MQAVATQPNDSGDHEVVLVHDVPLTGVKSLAPIVRDASRLEVWRGLGALVFDWAVIVSAIATAIHFPYVVVWLVAAVIVAGRQHAFLVLMHEASHYRLVHSRKWNDRISDWLLAWPLLINTRGFRADHLPHHLNLFTEKDPEWTRKRVRPDYQFPVSRLRFFMILAKDVLGLSIFKMCMLLANFSGAQQKENMQQDEPAWRTILVRTVYYAVCAAVIVYFNLVVPVLLLWFLPAFTLLFAILRVRNVAEHSGCAEENDLNMARNMLKPTLMERATVAPHNVNYHLVHHLYPSVPFYNLPRVHDALMSIPEYNERALNIDTYFGWAGPSVLNDLTFRPDGEAYKPAEDKQESANEVLHMVH